MYNIALQVLEGGRPLDCAAIVGRRIGTLHTRPPPLSPPGVVLQSNTTTHRDQTCAEIFK